MNILLFGATGTIGKHLIDHGLSEGHRITAFTRSPAKIKQQHASLTTVQGDVLEPAAVHDVVAGHDAVIIVLGAGARGGVRAAGTLNIIAAMQAHQVKRLICQTTLGAGDSHHNLNFIWKYIMFGFLLRHAYADHQLQEHYVRASGLDWTIVRPGAFTDTRLAKAYRHGFSTRDKTTLLKIAREDVATFLLHQLSTQQYLHKAPGLSY